MASGTNHTLEGFAYLKCLFLKNYGSKKSLTNVILMLKNQMSTEIRLMVRNPKISQFSSYKSFVNSND